MNVDRGPQPEGGGGPPAQKRTTFLREEREVLIERLRRIADHSPRAARYDVLGTIARGGMGRVLKVWDKDLQRELAMKVIEWRRAGSSTEAERDAYERMLARFVEEARITSSLDHPGIVPVHEIAFDREGAIYFTMPLVRGRDLESVIRSVHERDPEWSLTRAVGVLLKVCETVAFAHSKGVVHRDLKPTNVMVGPFGEAYVMDWGLALVQGRPQEDELVGTPAYMAPEQAGLEPSQVGPQADIYSLGAILYHQLAGCMPHAGSSVLGPLEAMERAPAPLARVAPDVPGELVAICEKAMARDPEGRYPDVSGLADDLRAFLEGRVVGVHARGPWAHLRKWAGRNRALAVSLQALLLVLVGSAAVIFLQQRRSIEVLAKETYAANLRAIDLGLRMNETAEVAARLNECPPDLRAWEWYHLALRADASYARLVDDGLPLYAIAFHPHGRVLATGSDTGGVTLWSPEDGSLVLRLECGARDVRALAFSHEGDLVAAGFRDGSVFLWDATDGSPHGSLASRGAELTAVVFERGGGRLWTGDQLGTIRAHGIASDEVEAVLERPPEQVRSLAIGPEGRLCYATYADDSLVAWDVATAFAERSSKVPGAGRMALDPSGTGLALGTREGAVLLIDTRTLQERLRLEGHGRAVTAVAFDESGERLVSGSFDATVRVWNVRDGSPLATWLGHGDEVNDVAFHPDGRRVASVSRDGTGRLWDLEPKHASHVALPSEHILSLAFDRTGSHVLVAGRTGRVTSVPVAGGSPRELLSFPDGVGCIAVSPDGRLLATGSREVELYDPESMTLIRTLEGHEEAVFTLLFSPDGSRLATRSADTVVRLWDPETGECLFTLPREEGDLAYPLAFDAKGERLASGHAGGLVRLWSVADGTPLDSARVPVPTPLVTCLAWSPTRDLLAIGTFEREIFLWEPGEDEPMLSLTHHVARVTALAFSPDGRRLVSGSQDMTVRVWDPAWGDLLLTLRGHEGEVTAVAFSNDGRNLASTDHRGNLRLWYGAEPPVTASR